MRIVRTLCYFVSFVRGVIGVLFAVRPAQMMGQLFGAGAGTTREKLIAGHYAVRDLGLGAGLFRSLREREREAEWMLAGTAADAVDLCAIAATTRPRPVPKTALVAGMTAIVLTDTVLTALLVRDRRLRRTRR